MTARSFLWLRSCSSSQPSLSAFQFCSDFQERASVHTFFFYGSGRPRPKGRRLVRWTGHAQGPAPSNGLCSSQRGNVDGLATTDNRLLSPERYLLTTLTANGLHTKESVWWSGWFNSLVFFVSRPVVCARLPRRPKRRKGGASRDGVPCAVHALRQRLHLPEEQASGGGGLPCAWGHHRRWLQQQAVPAHLQRFLAAGADAGGPRLQRGGVRPGEGGTVLLFPSLVLDFACLPRCAAPAVDLDTTVDAYASTAQQSLGLTKAATRMMRCQWVRMHAGREPERRVAGRGEDPGRRHFPSQEEKVGLRREGHRRPDQHLLRRGN